MFDDNDDQNEEYEKSEFEEWFDTYFMYFPPDFRTSGYDDVGVQCFYSKVYCRVMAELTPRVRRLMDKQYPIIKKEKRQAVLDEIDKIARNVGPAMLIHLFGLLYDDRSDVNFREKYINFQSFIEFYARPEKPRTLEEGFFDQFPWLSDEQKKQMVEDDRKEAQQICDWKEGRRREFFDIVQELLLKHYKEVLDLSPDGWIIYSMLLGEEYVDYTMSCDHIATFVQFEFPEEDLHLPYKEFSEKLQEMWEKRPDLRDCIIDDEDA